MPWESLLYNLKPNPIETMLTLRLVQSDIKHFPFRVSNQNDKPAITVEVQGKDRSFSPEEVSAMVLGKMKEIAESYLGKKVNSKRIKDCVACAKTSIGG